MARNKRVLSKMISEKSGKGEQYQVKSSKKRNRPLSAAMGA